MSHLCKMSPNVDHRSVGGGGGGGGDEPGEKGWYVAEMEGGEWIGERVSLSTVNVNDILLWIILGARCQSFQYNIFSISSMRV